MSRLWWIAAVTVGALGLIRRAYLKRLSSPPKLDEVSTDWLAYARSRNDESL